MLLRTSILEQTGLFDERFFMYYEDTDLTRRVHQFHRTVFYPKVTITHDFAKASHKNRRLLIAHIHSAIQYFNKWGWFFDAERTQINREIRKQFEQSKAASS